MHATRVIMVFLLPCALFDYYGLTRLPLRACLSHTLRLSKVSQFYRILLLSISVSVYALIPSYPSPILTHQPL